MKIFKYILKLIILSSVALVIYHKDIYKLIIFEKEINLEFLLLPLIIYFIVLYINNYINIKLYYKIILNFFTAIFSISVLGSLSYKLYLSYYTKSDYIINGWLFKLIRKWTKFDYISEAENIFSKKNFNQYVDLDNLYNKINPQSMSIWREKIHAFIVYSEENQKLVLNNELFLKTKIQEQESLFNFSFLTDKYVLLGCGLGVIFAVGTILYIRSEYSSIHYQVISDYLKDLFDTNKELTLCRKTVKEVIEILNEKKAQQVFAIDVGKGKPLIYVDKIWMSPGCRKYLDYIIQEASSDSLTFDQIADLYIKIKLLKLEFDEYGKINSLGRRNLYFNKVPEEQAARFTEKFKFLTRVLCRNEK